MQLQLRARQPSQGCERLGALHEGSARMAVGTLFETVCYLQRNEYVTSLSSPRALRLRLLVKSYLLTGQHSQLSHV